MTVEEEAIARGPVGKWLEERILSAAPPFDYQLIQGGLSNLTFLVTDGVGRRWVLRRPPLGKALGTAHDMGREVKVVSALEATPVPVPPVVGYCEDEAVTGAPFYVMDFVEGMVLRTPEQAAAYPEAAARQA
ncbi:MAG: phosphotransferase, partial [Solirubrobacterales bacterium]